MAGINLSSDPLFMYKLELLYLSWVPQTSGLPRSMPIKILALIPMSINSGQCWSIPGIDHSAELRRIEKNCEEFIGIDRQWSALRDISDQCHDFDRHWSALGNDRGSPETCTQRKRGTKNSTLGVLILEMIPFFKLFIVVHIYERSLTLLKSHFLKHTVLSSKTPKFIKILSKTWWHLMKDHHDRNQIQPVYAVALLLPIRRW